VLQVVAVGCRVRSGNQDYILATCVLKCAAVCCGVRNVLQLDAMSCRVDMKFSFWTHPPQKSKYIFFICTFTNIEDLSPGV